MFLAATREPPQLSLPSGPHRSFSGVPVASFFAPFFAERNSALTVRLARAFSG